MMGSPRSRRLVRHAAALALAAGVFIAMPSAPRAQAAQDPFCNLYNQGQVCKEQQDCVWFIFYKKCTTQYWRLKDMGGGGGPTDPPELDR